MTYIEIIEHAKKNNWKICLYGLGLYGRKIGEECLGYFGLEADYYCDANIEALDNWNAPDCQKITKEKLIMLDEEILVFICVNEAPGVDISSDFKSNRKIHTLIWTEMQHNQIVIDNYFGISKSKISNNKNISNEKMKVAVFTCVVGGYDSLVEPMIWDDSFDYYYISDMGMVAEDRGYRYIDVNTVVPEDFKSPKDKNRYCKMHGFEIFDDYDFSVYIDGNIRIIGDLKELLQNVGQIGLAFHRFTYGNDVYEHAMSLAIRERVRREDVSYEMRRLAETGFPRNYGLPECGVIICNHGSKIAISILKQWNEYYNGALAKRDQLYLPYILWKNGIKTEDVCTLPGNWRNNGYFRNVIEHSGFQL